MSKSRQSEMIIYQNENYIQRLFNDSPRLYLSRIINCYFHEICFFQKNTSRVSSTTCKIVNQLIKHSKSDNSRNNKILFHIAINASVITSFIQNYLAKNKSTSSFYWRNSLKLSDIVFQYRIINI